MSDQLRTLKMYVHRHHILNLIEYKKDEKTAEMCFFFWLKWGKSVMIDMHQTISELFNI